MEPNLQAIAISNGIGLVLLVSLLATSYLTRKRQHLEDRIFTLLIFVCAGACICETATWYSDGIAEPWAFFVNRFGNTYCYLATCIYAYIWVLYVDLRLHKGSERIRNFHPALLVPVVIISLAVIANIAFEFMFAIDENNVYSRLPPSYVNYVLAFSLLFYSVWLKHRFQREHGPVHFFPMGTFLVPVFLGAGLQAAIFGLSLAWTSVCIGLVSIHMSLQNELSYIDSLTNLYNRTYLDYLLQVMENGRKRSSGIMIDLDFFKTINDVHGHSTGDEALRQVASILTSCTPDDALVIRYAGDEFVVLLTETSEQEAADVESAIRENVDAFNAASNEPYRLSLSMGHSVFDPDTDTADEFLSRIDERMYEQKRMHHESTMQGGTR